MNDDAQGGNDILTGGSSYGGNANFESENLIFGDASSMGGKAQGGNDILTGGSSYGVSGNLQNLLVGDAPSMERSLR